MIQFCINIKKQHCLKLFNKLRKKTILLCFTEWTEAGWVLFLYTAHFAR